MNNQAKLSGEQSIRVKSAAAGVLKVKSALKAGKIATNHNARLR